MRALIKGCHIHGAARLWSRHKPPRAFTHIVVMGDAGKALLDRIVDMFIFGRDDWSKLEPEYKQPDGGVLHEFSAPTPLDIGLPRTDIGLPGYMASMSRVELYMPGHIAKHTNDHAIGGLPIVGLEADAEALAALRVDAVTWREDTATLSAAPEDCKTVDGKLRADTDKARASAVVSWSDAAALPMEREAPR